MKIKNEKIRMEILQYTKRKLKEDGYRSIHIRDIAKNVGISSGTVYNYFSNKDEILLVLTEDYWRQAIAQYQMKENQGPFYRKVEHMYDFLLSEIEHSAGLLMGSLQNVELIGRGLMEDMQLSLNKMLFDYIDVDDQIETSIWNRNFTKEEYVSFLVQNIILSLRMKRKDIYFLSELIQRTLYIRRV